MLAAIDGAPVEQIRSQSIDELVAAFVSEFGLVALELTEGAISVTVEEVPVDVSGDWNRAIFDRSKPHYVQGIAATYYVPYIGERDLFRCQPSTFTNTYPYADIGDHEILFRFERADSDVAATKRDFDHELVEIRKWLGWIAADVERFNSELPGIALQQLDARMTRLRQVDEGLQSLGILLHQGGQPSPQAGAMSVGPPAVRSESPPQVQQQRYDVALSFASEDRSYVEEVAQLLQSSGVTVFYDGFEKAKLWGKNLIDHLAEIYQRRARYVVMFISKHYVGKPWPTLERAHAQARALLANEEYILPARFDDTEVPGLAATVGYIDLRQMTPATFAALICKKLGKTQADA